jgi:serine/threonine-protein kinase
MQTVSHHAERRQARAAEEFRQALRHAAVLGGIAFVLLLGFDLYLRAALYPATSVVGCAAARLGGAALLLLGWLVFKRPGRSLTAMTVIASVLIAVSVVPLAWLTLGFGGLTSTYLYHLAFYAVGVGGLLASHWRRTSAMLVPAGVVYTAILFGGVYASPSLRHQLEDPAAVSEVIVNLSLVAAVGVFAVVIGHAQWRLRNALDDARRFGRYRFKAPLGQGGMSEVWLALDDELKREVALKILRSAHPDDLRHRRFEREARATSTLRSPHTIRIFDYGMSDAGMAWIAMEHLRGVDLARLVERDGALEVRRAIHFARQAAASIAEAHALGLIHRDIKPANLVALSAPGEEDQLKVLDFGIARQLGSEDMSLTLHGTIIGTPAFMAPEQLLGETADTHSDIYALAATLYCLLTGRLPIEGATPYELISAHQRQAIPPPSSLAPAPLPPALDALVMRSLAFDRAARPADGAAFLRALEELGVPPWTHDEARAWWASRRAAYGSGARSDAMTPEATTVPDRP